MQDPKSAALGVVSTADPRRFEPDFYIEKIPRDAATLELLKKSRDTATLGMGMMYDDFFSDTPLATQTLYDLVDNQPEEKVMLLSLYEIFIMNYENNPAAAERAKQILLKDYPYTSYAEFARNPRNKSFVKSAPEAERAYRTAFAYYENEKFTESQAIIHDALQQHKNDALVPKFALLNALNAGKLSGKEVMILQLEQIALNYDKTMEGEKAKEMLNWLKSDLKVQMRDEKGNVIHKNAAPPAPVKKADAPINTAPSNVLQKQQNDAAKKAEERSLEQAQENPLAPPTLPKQRK